LGQKTPIESVKGHEKGSETVRTIVKTSRELGIKYLTLYAFSTETGNDRKQKSPP